MLARVDLEDGHNVGTNKLRSGGQKMLSKHRTRILVHARRLGRCGHGPSNGLHLDSWLFRLNQKQTLVVATVSVVASLLE